MPTEQPIAPEPEIRGQKPGYLEVGLPTGEWCVQVKCETVGQPIEKSESSQAEEDRKPAGPYVRKQQPVGGYILQLHEQMWLGLSIEDLRTISFRLGLGTDLIGSTRVGYQCTQLIDACRRRGYSMMERLLEELRRLNPERFSSFPPVPDDEALW